MDSNVDYDEVTQDFMNVTGASIEKATEYLTASNWDHNIAVQSYYADIDDNDAMDEDAGAATSSAAPPDYTGPRTLDGRPAPQAIPAASSASTSKRPQKKTGLATLSSLGGNRDDDDDDDEDDRRRGGRDHRDTYAGGEKSGLAVQDPNKRSDPRQMINRLIAKAKSEQERPPPSDHAGPSSSSAFRGVGQTLGGEGTESRMIPDPNPRPIPAHHHEGPVQERTLHLWRDGFSVDDGELHRFDDPNNAEALRQIQLGRAPPHLMNVRPNEPLDVKLEKHDENYRQLPKVYRPFSGEGRRLGSPVPGEPVPTLSSNLNTAAPSASAPASAPTPTVDESQPTVMIRIQMPDGTRLPARFNTSQTVNDIYDFISRASPDLRAGGYVLATTFPNKEHTDKAQVIGEMAEFKKGGTAVVKRA